MNIVALAGGVGGAKLADGLARTKNEQDQLTVIVNTGDDFVHCGLKICPDLDTVCYTLAGLANELTGWGRKDETWQAFSNLKTLGGPGWFHLGDQDIGVHLERTRRLIAGEPLSRITRSFCEAWNINCDVLPMTDDLFSTMVETAEEGWLSFQEYFVKHSCRPQVISFSFIGMDKAKPAPGVLNSIGEADVIIVCPSNPFVSIAPILSVPGIKEAILVKNSVVAVSPIVGGKAIKGPAAKMFQEFGREPSSYAVAAEYQDWIKGIVIDHQDAANRGAIEEMGIAVDVENTIMLDTSSRKELAKRVINFGVDIIRGELHE